MTGQSKAIRQVLQYAADFRNSTVLIAPSSIGPFDEEGLEMLLRDVALLVRVGMSMTIVEYQARPFWKGVECPDNIPVATLSSEDAFLPFVREQKPGKICFVAGADRVAASGNALDDVPVAAAEMLLESGAFLTVQSRRALALAVSACRGGVPRVHFINAHRQGALLEELFTGHGAGTMVYSGEVHKEVRVATRDDRFSLLELLAPVIPRQTTGFVRDHLGELRVFVVDGEVHGSARLIVHEGMLSVRLLRHSANFNAAEVLQRLLQAALDEARQRGLSTTVVVPANEIPPLMRIQPWFAKLGFVKGRVASGAGREDAWLKTA